MSLRAIPAAWFEILVGRDCVARAMQVLAESGLVELDGLRSHEVSADIERLKDRLLQDRDSAVHGEAYQPQPVFRELGHEIDVVAILDAALERFRLWAQAVRPIIRALETNLHELEQARLIEEALLEANEQGVDLPAAADIGPDAYRGLYVFEESAAPPDVATDAIHHWIKTRGHQFIVVVARSDQKQSLEARIADAQGHVIKWPDWLRGPQQFALSAGQDRIKALQSLVNQARQAIDAKSRQLGVAEARGDVIRLRWLAGQLGGICMRDHVATVTGWTSDRQGDTLRSLLSAAGIAVVVHLPKPPDNRRPPTLVVNPSWARPFEMLTRLMGTPGLGETDPSRLLALIVPVLFGFMFGDLGQGAVLMAVGLLAHRRWPPLALLIPCGFMAMVFGLLFGSVFSMEHLIPALWLQPLDRPLEILVIPLLFGGGLMALGLLLGALQAAWVGETGSWMLRDAGLLVAFCSLPGLSISPAFLIVVAAGALWFAVGGAWIANRRAHEPLGSALIASLGTFVERALQLAVNTLSFVRVGAFALAHAGLGLALSALTSASDSWVLAAFILVLGNLAILILEGLVVSIQTTRLVLFEFFVRFFKAEGRPFQPIGLPH